MKLTAWRKRKMSEDYCVEEEANQCEGCIYNIVGERKDRKGYVMKTSACLCEEYMAAGCIPTYQFSDSDIYEGKMKIGKEKIVFKISASKKLRENVSFNMK
jgi:hypothetical protein